MNQNPFFKSFFMGGFECSSQRRRDGHRLDLLESTGHARLALEDYRALARQGMRTARDGFRWHLIEERPGRYDWSSVLPQLRAAREAGIEVIWDLCHYGWPDDLDIWSLQFVERFARFSAAAAEIATAEMDTVPTFCPMNEISYLAWAGGEVGRFFPGRRRRGAVLKRQLVRAAVASADAIRAAIPGARLLWAEPAIHVLARGAAQDEMLDAERYRLAQYEALDMICGRLAPELGGDDKYLDVIGLNFYPDNQWYWKGGTIPMGHHAYRPFRAILVEAYRRYQRPLIVSETGAEGTGRASWFHYVASEVRAAIDAGSPVHGICLYPVLDYPGWDDERICDVGLFSMPNPHGVRSLHEPLAAELGQQIKLITAPFEVEEDTHAA